MEGKNKKSVIFVFAGIGLLILVVWVGSAVYSAWSGYRWKKKTEEFQMALSKPYREDIYGGKTPEETWAMFLDALKKGDVELASKYIVPEKREDELKFLKKEKSTDNLKLLLSQFAGSIVQDEQNSSDEIVYFNYSIKDETSGLQYANSLVFILNPYTKVWKISLL